MKSLRFFFLFLAVSLVFSSCEKEDTEALAKNKALKEKVAAEMKKAAANDAKKKVAKKATPKKTTKSTKKDGAKKEIAKGAKKLDPVLANRPNQKPSPKKDDDDSDEDTKEDVKQPIAKKVEAKPDVKVSARSKKQVTLRPAVIEIVTNFDEADATVNGRPYPEYVPQGEQPGMIVPAGGPYSIEIKMGENVKYYDLYLKPNETRTLFVSSTGGSSAVRPKKSKPKKVEKKKEDKKKEKKDEDKAPGKVTVYGKPTGTIMVDGVDKGEKTPGTIEMKNGRHEIQVKYDESGEISEKKIVRVRSGSKIKLFFRERKK